MLARISDRVADQMAAPAAPSIAQAINSPANRHQTTNLMAIIAKAKAA
jgi:hypothetical protein